MPFIPHTKADTDAMLKEIGIKHIDELFSAIPDSMRPKSFNIPDGLSEHETCAWFDDIASKNTSGLTSFLGGGFYEHAIPKAVSALAGRSEFYTAYTPYQPEASQGTLQAIFEYQTAVCRLLGMDVANASVYDGGSAIFEACLMAVRLTKRSVVLVDEGVNPLYREILHTLSANLDITIKNIPMQGTGTQVEAFTKELNDSVAAVIVQNPAFLGGISDYTALAEKIHAVDALLIMSVNPVLQAIVKTAGEMGADIAVAEGQSVGQPVAFGGPYLGIMTCKQSMIRQLPGRIVGRTKDANGDVGYVLTLQAREQHIRRAKATSNICSNQSLCALRTLFHLTLLGDEGLERTALLSMQQARKAADALTKISGVSLLDDTPFGYEFAIKLPKPAKEVVTAMASKKFLAGIPLGIWYKGMDNVLLVACTETTTTAQIDSFAKTLASVL